MLNLDQDFKKAKEKIGCDETRNKVENKNNLSDINGSLSMDRSLSRYDKDNSNENDSSNCDTSKTVGATPSSRMDRTERINATKVDFEVIFTMSRILASYILLCNH